MKTFKQFLEEALDSSYEYEYMGPAKSSEGRYFHHNYAFNPDGKSRIAVGIDHRNHGDGKMRGVVVFKRESDHSEEMTGEHPKTATKVLGTIRKILNDHAKKHGIYEYDFKADRTEPSRVSLYKKLAWKSGGEERFSTDSRYAQFRVKIPKPRKKK